MQHWDLTHTLSCGTVSEPLLRRIPTGNDWGIIIATTSLRQLFKTS